MAKVEIDNGKMWAAIGKVIETAEALKRVLEDQGLGYKGGEIVSIEPEPFKIEAGKFYVCINNKTEYGVISYTEGKVYQCSNDNFLLNDSNMPCSWCVDAELYFRPATEEEITKHNLQDNSFRRMMETKSKFNIGDWVVSPNGVYWHIDKIENNRYQVSCSTGECAEWPFSSERLYHLFSIQDAMDGDVLATKDAVFIFKHKDNYCEVIGNSELGFGFDFSINGIYPATKEQRDLLFAKMKAAGYEWDAEKKELKKLLTATNFDYNNADIPQKDFAEPKQELTEQEFFNLSKGTVIITPEGYDYMMGGEVLYPDNPNKDFSIIRWHKFDHKGCRLATEEETKRYFEKLESNGWKWLPDTGKMEHKQELTEFEEAVQQLANCIATAGTTEVIVDAASTNKLLSIARKQIASEIDTEDLVEEKKDSLNLERDANFAFGAYRQGIEDTIKAIKGK